MWCPSVPFAVYHGMPSHPTATVRHTAHKLWEGAGAFENHSGISIQMDGGRAQRKSRQRVGRPRRLREIRVLRRGLEGGVGRGR